MPPLRPRSAVMSSDVVARVLAFAKKANELCDKGHALRAAENYGHAAEAARVLGADNLVALQMKLEHGNMLCVYATNAPIFTTDPRVMAAHRAECITLLSGAVEALERRRVAGTLLEGKCTAVEEAWRARETQQRSTHMPAAIAVSLATMVGHEAFMDAATRALTVLGLAPMFADECSYQQFQTFAQHVVRATELMQQPRRHNTVLMKMEAAITDNLRFIIDDAGVKRLDARMMQLLASALQQLQRSGVLRARGIEDIQLVTTEKEAFQEAVRNSLNAPDLRSCALAGCGAKEAHPAHFKSCAACRTVVYCCCEHQVAGWPALKKACEAARKAAAAKDEEAGPSGT